MPFSPFPIRHDGRLGDWRSCWSGVRRWLTLWCHRVPAQDKASRRKVVHAGTSGALVPRLREINLVRRMGAADRRELSEAVTSGEIGQSGVGAEGCQAAKASSSADATRAVSSSNAVTIHASKVHVDREPRDVSGTLSRVCLLNG